MSSEHTGAKDIIETVERLSVPHHIHLPEDEDQIVALPSGMQVHDLLKYQEARLARPRRIEGVAQLTTLDAFIDHVKRFADDGSAVFAIDDPAKPRLVAVYDYHEPREPDDLASVDNARFCKHRAVYAFPLDPAWVLWTGLARKAEGLSQGEFAELLEERIGDVLPADDAGTAALELSKHLGIELAGPSELMAVSRGISLRRSVEVREAVRLASGEVNIQFVDAALNEPSAMKVPTGFAIQVPIFRCGAPWKLPVRLRYRLAGGQVRWHFLLHRVDLSFENAFTGALALVKAECQVPVLRGRPEKLPGTTTPEE